MAINFGNGIISKTDPNLILDQESYFKLIPYYPKQS